MKCKNCGEDLRVTYCPKCFSRAAEGEVFFTTVGAAKAFLLADKEARIQELESELAALREAHEAVLTYAVEELKARDKKIATLNQTLEAVLSLAKKATDLAKRLQERLENKL